MHFLCFLSGLLSRVRLSTDIRTEAIIPHYYGTRANKKAMEDERNERMERDIEELKANMAKLMDMIQALATARENPPPPVVPETTL